MGMGASSPPGPLSRARPTPELYSSTMCHGVLSTTGVGGGQSPKCAAGTEADMTRATAPCTRDGVGTDGQETASARGRGRQSHCQTGVRECLRGGVSACERVCTRARANACAERSCARLQGGRGRPDTGFLEGKGTQHSPCGAERATGGLRRGHCCGAGSNTRAETTGTWELGNRDPGCLRATVPNPQACRAHGSPPD